MIAKAEPDPAALSAADAADYVFQIAGEMAQIAFAGGLKNVAHALELARDLAGEQLQSGATKAAPAREA